jgi:hypothetical protein
MIRHTLLLLLCALLSTATAAQPPERYDCESTAEHRQFDFWLGSWEVADKAGEKIYGQNRISKRENGCLLLEEYTTTSGFSGSSMNYYDPSDGKWHQHWVDNGSSIIHTAGGIENGSMVMRGTIYYLAGSRAAEFRGSWTPLEDGRVRQFFEEKDSSGQWKTWFDGYYRKVVPPADQ